MIWQVYYAHTDNNFIKDPKYRGWKVPIVAVAYAVCFILEISFLIEMSGKT